MTAIGKELKMAKVTLLCSCVAVFLLLSGCGGGAGSPLPLPVNKAIILSASLKPGVPATTLPVVAIEVTFVLPKTATPTYTAYDGSLQIDETGLKGLNPKGSVSTGSYDQTTGTVHFILLPNNVASDLGVGDIARLTYETASGAELSPQEIQQIQQTLSYNVSGPGSIDISAQIEPSVRIVTYQKP